MQLSESVFKPKLTMSFGSAQRKKRTAVGNTSWNETQGQRMENHKR